MVGPLVLGSCDYDFRNQRIKLVSNAKFLVDWTLGTHFSLPWQRLLGDRYLRMSSFLVGGTKIFEFSILDLVSVPNFKVIRQL